MKFFAFKSIYRVKLSNSTFERRIKPTGYATANLHAQYRMGNFTFTGYVNNLFDRFAQTSRTTSFNQAYFNDPRTVGVNVKVEF